MKQARRWKLSAAQRADIPDLGRTFKRKSAIITRSMSSNLSSELHTSSELRFRINHETSMR